MTTAHLVGILLDMSNSIDRKTAEAARRAVLVIDATEPRMPGHDAIRAESVKLWNEFCAQETRRLERKNAWSEGEINRGWALHLY